MNDDPVLDQFRAESVLRRLYGFQRDAVEHAFHRLFIAPDSTHRFLVADEVGLGKTLIAAGVIAKAIEHLRETVNRIDILYICSNQGIARQNINRLNPLPDRPLQTAERITLLPRHLQAMSSSSINLIAFTPGTSLDIKDSLGTQDERILLQLLLELIWGLKGVGSMNLLQGEVKDADRFRDRIAAQRQQYQAAFQSSENLSLMQGFCDRLSKGDNLRERFRALCERFGRTRLNIPEEDRRDRSEMVGQLRSVLAKSCIDKLEPDLIILDEFQRFKDLLENKDDAGELAHQLFEWQSETHEQEHAHVLLLSATPYKPYTLQHEENEDDHYRDFIRTVAFLRRDHQGGDGLKRLFRQFRQELLHMAPGFRERLKGLKVAIETELRKIMSRTERLAVAGDQNGMLRSVVKRDLDVAAEDLKAYVATRGICNAVEVDDPIEYWKSAAYAVNFMEGYRLKQSLKERVATGVVDDGILNAVRAAKDAMLPLNVGDGAVVHSLPNAKLRELVRELDEASAFDLLWLPPSLPAYELQGAFARAKNGGLTKRLIFSAWNVVPRSLAVLVSHEAERRGATTDTASGDSPATPKEQSSLLRFSMDEGRPSGMPVLALMYPSRALAVVGDLREFYQSNRDALAGWNEVYEWAKARVRAALPADILWAESGQSGDGEWYWASPIMLDVRLDVAQCASWWNQHQLASIWAAADVEDDELRINEAGEAGTSAWERHIELARKCAQPGYRPKGPAPADLVDLLALLALAAPGNCAFRALRQLFPRPEDALVVQDAAAQVGWSFRRLLNRPQSVPIVRAAERDAPYWRLALKYCAIGGLGSVLEEYVPVLRDETGVAAQTAPVACEAISGAMAEALGLRAATLAVDQIQVAEDTGMLLLTDMRLRSLFAMRFGSDKAEDAKQVIRDRSVRVAFNSPFWPFVLASTSVGQEGLDFHWYCHAVVHWNLPSNPVDLEQREGRVHRFKGHAIRKNVAQRWGLQALHSDKPDLWAAAFEMAHTRVDNTVSHKGLVPYWLYPLEDGAWIERHVPLYPLSRDVIRYKSLLEALGVYRLVFGQPRQDELLAYLRGQVDLEKLKELEQVLRIDLAPPPSSASPKLELYTDEQRAEHIAEVGLSSRR